jgi:NADH-quinone oxidoreductase subunit A
MTGYGAALLLLGLVSLAITAIYAVGMLLAPAPRPLPAEPFLSGMAASEHALSRYHVRWYAVSLLFLAFDMEMVFMYPWAVVFAEIGVKALVEMGLFLLILVLGVLYAWREGALRWS